MSAAEQRNCFGGRELRKFDQVNRIAIPARFRARYGDAVYLFKNFQSKCLIAYSEEDYLTVYDNIAKTYSGENLARAQRIFLDSIDMAALDKAGRITIKPEFIEFAGLKDDVLIICYPDRLELWDEATWNAQFKTEEMPDLSLFNVSPRG